MLPPLMLFCPITWNCAYWAILRPFSISYLRKYNLTVKQARIAILAILAKDLRGRSCLSVLIVFFRQTCPSSKDILNKKSNRSYFHNNYTVVAPLVMVMVAFRPLEDLLNADVVGKYGRSGGWMYCQLIWVPSDPERLHSNPNRLRKNLGDKPRGSTHVP